jgi:hypothetical protein
MLDQKKIHWEYGSMDWGFSDETVLHWIGCDEDGRMIVYDELAAHNRTPSQFVSLVKARRKPPQIIFLDPRCWGPESDGKSVAEKFRAAGLHGVQQADNRFPASLTQLRELMAAQSMFTKPFLMFVEGRAHKAVSQLAKMEDTHLRPTGGGFKDGVDCHATDSIRYGSMAVVGRQKHIDPRPMGPLAHGFRGGFKGRIAPDELAVDPITGIPL